MDVPKDVRIQSNPVTRRRQSVIQPPRMLGSSTSIQTAAASSLPQIQNQASDEFHGLHAGMESHRLKHHNQRVLGLDDHALPLWGHVMEHAPSNADEIQDLSAAANNLQETAAQAARTFSSLERAKDAQMQLDQLKVQKSADVHRKMVDKMETFLQEHPSLVTELQEKGVDLGAVSRRSLHTAEVALDDVVQSNHWLMNDKEGLTAKLSQTSVETKSLRADLAKTSERLKQSRALRFRTMVRHAALARKSEHLKQALHEREEAEQTRATRWQESNKDLQANLSDKDTRLQNLSIELSREKNESARQTSDLRGQLSTKQDLIGTLEEDADRLRGQVSAKQGRIKALESDVDGLRSQLADISDSRSYYRKESQNLRLQSAFAEQKVKDQNEKLATVSDSRAALEHELAETQQRLKATKDEVKRLRHEEASHRNRLHELQSQHEAVLRNLSTCQQEYTSKAQQVGMLKNQLTDMSQEAGNLKNQLTDKSQEVAKLKDQLRDVNADVAALQRDLNESSEQARATITDQKIGIQTICEDRNAQHAAYSELETKHRSLRLDASAKTQALQDELTAAKQRNEELTAAVQAHAQDALDSADHVESIDFECSRLQAESKSDKAAKAGSVQENAGLKRKRSDLQSSVERLREAGDVTAPLNTQRASVDERTDNVLEYLARYSQTIKHNLKLACQTTGSKQKRIKEANQAIEPSNHRDCHKDRQDFENLRELAETQENESVQIGQRLAGYQKWVSITCIHDSDRDNVDTVALEQCLLGVQTLPAGAGFSQSRLSPSPIVHGLTFTYTVHSVKEQATKMLVYCFRNPLRLQLADLYSLDQPLDQAKPEDRNAALLILHAVLKVQIEHSEHAGACSFATSMFILHSMELLCAWSGLELAETLDLNRLYARAEPLLAVTNVLVRALATLVDGRLKSDFVKTLPALLSRDLEHQLQGSGYIYGQYQNDILVFTPAGHVVYVHVCQCSVGTYDQGDAWLQAPELGLRLRFHDVPILGTFTSCIWTYTQIGNHMSLFGAAAERTALDKEPSPPSDAALSLLID